MDKMPSHDIVDTNTGKVVLIVEDETDIQELISYHLKQEGYSVLQALDGRQALEQIKVGTPNLVLLDLMLPELSGLEVLKTIRYSWGMTALPVLIASARTEESDIIMGLEIGADDYITKPFSPKVLIARVKAILRRTQEQESRAASPKKEDTDIIKTPGGLTMDISRYGCEYKGTKLNLTATEFAILHLLAGCVGRVFTRNQIISTIKGDDYPVTERSIDVQMASVRRKLGEGGAALKTVWGIGYKYQEEET
ncbi:response regulator transcription factor [Parasphaerochaeta coccoides]|uniref:Two component transcriptional regulator, winged helix family n=1 Tax=Parasphaerochaeta coccoides (strain ATCC BAA-1237 / DSM 17374 / SPN1) TaxID=760011 RepID=F4GIE3_PARC1|nr:response regulator transcription factor [Parasphaerochaeta coccoides]AEC01651.1 two component transcriptional regulator, winged helix family [Parasphaerochaeta coccoides DSM 17374]